jgi:N-acyl-L-homoserine lactone synthetase
MFSYLQLSSNSKSHFKLDIHVAAMMRRRKAMMIKKKKKKKKKEEEEEEDDYDNSSNNHVLISFSFSVTFIFLHHVMSQHIYN